MATTEKLKSGRHRGVYYDAAGGKRHTPAVGRKRDAKAAAVKAEAESKRQAAASTGDLPGHIPYGEWFEVWWKDRDIEPSTRAAEERLFRRHILPFWQDEELARIGQPAVQAWVTHKHRGEGLGGSYVGRIYTPFRSSMNAAVKAEVLTASPCVAIKMPAKSGGGIERVYEADELDAIFKHLSWEYQFAAQFIAETGLRPGEFAGLHRHRINRRTGWLIVRDVYDRVAKRIKTYPKDKDERSVPLTSRAEMLLDEYDRRHPPTAVNCGIRHQNGKCKSDILWRQPVKHGPLNTSTFYAVWTKAQRTAGIMPIGRPYDLRHLFGTTLAEAGVDPWEISRLMGHASLDQTGDYTHRTSRARMRVLAALGDPAAQGLAVVEGGAAQVENPAVRPTEIPRSS